MKYSTKQILFLFSLLTCFSYAQQNLVLNPSFEDINQDRLSCNYSINVGDFNDAINAWTLPSTGSSDIFNTNLELNCATNPLNPLNPSILPRTGNSMVGLIAMEYHRYSIPDYTSYKEYIQGQLSTPLEVGVSYTIKFYIAHGSISQLAINNIGIKFLTTPYFQEYNTIINMVPDVNYTNVINTLGVWNLIEFRFTPQTPDLKYFIIGNFFRTEQNNIEILPQTGIIESYKTAYYHIDDVFIGTTISAIFGPLGPICRGASFSLPETSQNGYTGTWSPEFNNQETTTYTFTPDNPDIEPTILTIEVIDPSIVPTFNFETTVCKGNAIDFPIVSENGIIGTWSPIFNNQETTTYTFTPEEGSCGIETSVTIQIVEKTIPIFSIPTSICEGSLFSLPLTSENGITGTWLPEFNNQQTTTYTFKPDESSCGTELSMTIQITEKTIPIFSIPSSLCINTNYTLPIVSQNNITGTWSPAFNNQQTTTYTFTPEDGNCAKETSISIEIVDKLIPEFDLPSFICLGTDFILPEISKNGIAGTWLPAFNNQQTTTYTFWPLEENCVSNITITMEVKKAEKPILTTYCLKGNFYIESSAADADLQFEWQVNGIVISENSPLINLSRYNNLLYDNKNNIELTIVNQAGCIVTNSIEIESKEPCFIPKGISPQGDGLNDSFNLSHFGGVYLQIFNRYGMKVYDKKNYKNEWFGQTNSSNTLLPSGTYFYQINTHKGELLSGWIQLIY
ncbi:gliding motility-associated C-terminal domain-containing protein [Myroides odoratus]|uniref:gliding motility-associated C-terminal domain-containing protein n=1 Tax=Myroides odoratus TaxID=256 RepID=UPI0033410CF6